VSDRRFPRLIIERVFTRDHRVDDADGEGWRMIPVPPSSGDGLGEWHIVDSSSDRKPGWQRFRVE
jgi:hypothetical protein